MNASMKVNINIEKKEMFVFHDYIILVCKFIQLNDLDDI